MPSRPTLMLLASSLFLGACENHDWPPFEQTLIDFFHEHRSSLEELEREMESDGYRRMNSRILSGSLSHPAAPQLDDAEIRKYQQLVVRDDRELSVMRRPGATEFELLTEPVGTSLYLFRFIRDAAGEAASECDASMRDRPCGRCSIDLDGRWRLEYDWFPQDLDEEARKCR